MSNLQAQVKVLLRSKKKKITGLGADNLSHFSHYQKFSRVI